MPCPLCHGRKARRACPALGHSICPVCCGSKRLTEIRCPPTCVYLASAREHPPAVVVRRQQRDVAVLTELFRDFSDRQAQLCLMLATFLTRYQPDELQPIIDLDVREAAAALAATFETAARGVIYDHRPASRPAERLAAALKPQLLEAGQGGGSAFERDAAVVLRRMETMISTLGDDEAGNRRRFLELMARVARETAQGEASRDPAPDGPRLLVP